MLPDTRQRLEEAFQELQGLVVRLLRCWPAVPQCCPHVLNRLANSSSADSTGAGLVLLPQEELGSSLAGSEELAQAEEQIAAAQPVLT